MAQYMNPDDYPSYMREGILNNNRLAALRTGQTFISTAPQTSSASSSHVVVSVPTRQHVVTTNPSYRPVVVTTNPPSSVQLVVTTNPPSSGQLVVTTNPHIHIMTHGVGTNPVVTTIQGHVIIGHPVGFFY